MDHLCYSQSRVCYYSRQTDKGIKAQREKGPRKTLHWDSDEAGVKAGGDLSRHVWNHCALQRNFFFSGSLWFIHSGKSVPGPTASPCQMCVGSSKDSVTPNTHPAGPPGSSGPAGTGRPAESRSRSSACSPGMRGARWGHRPGDRGLGGKGCPCYHRTLRSQHLHPPRDPQHQSPRSPRVLSGRSRDPGQLTSS